MSFPLRTPSARPTLIVDSRSRSLSDADTPIPNRIGRAGPFGRSRVVYALPITENPLQWVKPNTLLVDPRAGAVSDPALDLIGKDKGVYIGRLLTARWTEDTRRLAG
jgi:hypothetical protein